MAAAVRMMSVIREEIPAVVGEIASTAKVSTEQVGRLGEMEVASISTSTTTTTATATMNPIVVRQMASVAAKEGESSILSSLRAGNQASSHPHSLLETLPHTQLPSINTSMVSQAIEMEGVSLREVMSNASQTGAGDVLEQVQLGDLAKVVAAGPGGAHV